MPGFYMSDSYVSKGIFQCARGHWQSLVPYSSKFSLHNIFVNFVIWLLITKIFLTNFSIIVAWLRSMCVHMHIAITVQVRSMFQYRLYVYFQKISKVTYQIRKDVTFVQNFLLVSNPPTIMLKRWPNKMIAEGAKHRKKVQYKSCLISFSSH